MSRDDSTPPRRVRLFRNGRNQAVRIPRDLELPGNEALLRKEGDRLILEPALPRSLLAVLATLEPLGTAEADAFAADLARAREESGGPPGGAWGS